MSSTPRVSIGAVDGSDEDILINVLMATVLSDGTVVLRNSTRGVFEIRYYDRDGAHLHTVSRFGQGPYEFLFPKGVYRLPGDSIFVAGEDDRFAVFGPRGERGREGRMGMGSLLPASSWLAMDSSRVVFTRTGNTGLPELGTRRSVSTLWAYDLESQALDSIATIGSRITYRERIASGVAWYSVPFSPQGHVAAGAGIVWVGDSETAGILGYRPGSPDPVVSIQSPFEPREVSRADRVRAREAYAQLFSGDTQQRWARYARSMAFPEHMPRFGQLKVDLSGNLWVQEYEPFWAEGDQHWVVFDSSGQQIATVAVPPVALPPCARRPAFPCTRLTGIFEIGDDYMVVPQWDELRVRYLRVFDLRREAPPAF